MDMSNVAISRLKPNSENLFSPLTGKDYADLKESISQHGVQEPLIVTKDVNGGYKIICGHNRHRIAVELNIEELPCIVVENHLEIAAVDTEIYRRHLTQEEKGKYTALKRDMEKKHLETEIREKLHPGITELFNAGQLSSQDISYILKLPKDAQKALVDNLTREKEVIKEVKVGVDKEALTAAGPTNTELKILQEENTRLSETLTNLKTDLTTKESQVKSIQAATADLVKIHKKKLEALELDLENAKSDADGTIIKDHQEELEERRKSLVEMSKAVEERQSQIDSLKDDIARLKDQVLGREVDAKTSVMARMDIQAQLTKERIRYANPALLQRRLDTIVAELDTLLDHVIHYNWDEAVLLATENAGRIVAQKFTTLAGKIKETLVSEDAPKGQLKMVK